MTMQTPIQSNYSKNWLNRRTLCHTDDLTLRPDAPDVTLHSAHQPVDEGDMPQNADPLRDTQTVECTELHHDVSTTLAVDTRDPLSLAVTT